MFIFIDESGSTDAKNHQDFLVIAFALSSNHSFPEQLIFNIRDRCRARGKPIFAKELKYYDLTQFQREIAIREINAHYRNFYVCYFDVGKANRNLVTGSYEEQIQMKSIYNVLAKLDKRDLVRGGYVKVIMDKKLSESSQSEIRHKFQEHLGTKKGITVQTASSSKERGIQLADLIAGAARAKLIKKSDLLEIDLTHSFQISATDIDHLSVMSDK